MSFVGNAVKSIVGGITGRTAAKAASEASGVQADYLNRALDYLMQQEQAPSQFRELALQRQAGLAGLEGGIGGQFAGFDQQQLIDDALQSPLYKAILGTQDAGEEAILRNASATGGLRSGNVQDALAENAQQIQQNALLQSFNQQLQQRQYGDAQLQQALGVLTGTPSLSPQIAGTLGGIGQTQAQGITAGAQAQQAGLGNIFNLGAAFTSDGDGGGLSGILSTAAAAFSDIRLKQDIKPIGVKNGHTWYEWTWNKAAEKLGLTGKSQGVMAHEVGFENVLLSESGYLMVDYNGVLNGN